MFVIRVIFFVPSLDGALTWLYKGAVLEVLATSSGNRVASLHVEHLLKDEQASIVVVCEFSRQGRTLLLVAVNGASEQGLVVLLNVATSMVVKAVEVPQQVIILIKYLSSFIAKYAILGLGSPRFTLQPKITHDLNNNTLRSLQVLQF